jgi:hypothetical protein
MSERRRYPRVPVDWPVRLWVGEDAIVGRALDASEWGICVATAPTVDLKIGRSYRIDVLSETRGERSFFAEVRQVGPRGAGMRTSQPIVLP